MSKNQSFRTTHLHIVQRKNLPVVFDRHCKIYV